MHQDKNERDFGQPIVSVSLGIPGTFLFGGTTRSGKTMRVPVVHGDVVVWGGPARLRYHGVMPLKGGFHPQVGAYRVNLTFRKEHDEGQAEDAATDGTFPEFSETPITSSSMP